VVNTKMRDYSHIPESTGNGDVQTFIGDAQAVNTSWKTWIKPRGKTMLHIMLAGAGGNGGTGVIGANSVSAGGAGGQSGAISCILVPLHYIPDILYVCIAGRKPTATANFASMISVTSSNTSSNILVFANGGLHGGNASAGTGGTVGTAAAIASATLMPLGWLFGQVMLASQVGVAGGAAVAGANLTLPSTGGFLLGGTGGGGLPAAAAAGTSGGNITGTTGFPTLIGGLGSATATNPADFGKAGMKPITGCGFRYGGTGGASTHGTATGGGLVQSNGGDGDLGCGGGGQGGALTGSTAGVVGMGGAGFAIFTCW
jgi:hypothetical protein